MKKILLALLLLVALPCFALAQTSPSTAPGGSAGISGPAAPSSLFHWLAIPPGTARTACVFGDSTSLSTIAAGAIYTELLAYNYPGGELDGATFQDCAANGQTLYNALTQTGPTPQGGIGYVVAQNTNLVVLSFGLNDWRTGVESRTHFIADLTAAVTAIRAANANTDIILRIPDPMLTTDPTSSGYVTAPTNLVANVTNNGSGLCRITIGGPSGQPTNPASTEGWATGDAAQCQAVAGATGAACNGTFTATVVDETHVDLQGTTFAGTYTSGGSLTGGTLANVATRYSLNMRASYLSLANMWPNVVIFDAPLLVFGPTPVATSPLMTDILHPSGPGYTLIAREIVKLTSTKPPFSKAQAMSARSAAPTAPYTVYSREVEDPEFYQPIVTSARLASAVTAGATVVPVDFGSIPLNQTGIYSQGDATTRDPLRFLTLDIIQIGTDAILLPAGFSPGLTGSTINFSSASFASEITKNYAINTPVAIYRSIGMWDENVRGFTNQNKTYPLRARVVIGNRFNGSIDLLPVTADAEVPSWEHLPEVNDVLVVPGNAPLTINPSQTQATGNGVIIFQALDFTTWSLTQGGGYGFLFKKNPMSPGQDRGRPPPAKLVVVGALSTSSVAKDISGVSHQITPTESRGVLGTAGTVQATNVNIKQNGTQVATCNFAISATTCTLSATLYAKPGDIFEADVAQAGTSAADLFLSLN